MLVRKSQYVYDLTEGHDNEHTHRLTEREFSTQLNWFEVTTEERRDILSTVGLPVSGRFGVKERELSLPRRPMLIKNA